MLCDAVNEEDLYDAFRVYASLHGMSTDELEVRDRISRYMANEPDEVIDIAILAYEEDRIVAPPDVVLSGWGKSRVYELEQLPLGGWRHQVSEAWFEQGCQFTSDAPPIGHFWTCVPVPADQSPLPAGTRFQFALRGESEKNDSAEEGSFEPGSVDVIHRKQGIIGSLPKPLAEEILSRSESDIRYLALVDRELEVEEQEEFISVHATNEDGMYKLLVTFADPEVPTSAVVEYATAAFMAQRKKC